MWHADLKNEKVMLVVDNDFRSIVTLNDTMVESLRRIYNLHNTNETVKIGYFYVYFTFEGNSVG
jgi:hypothetical protein